VEGKEKHHFMISKQQPNSMMKPSGTKFSGVKIVPHLDLRVGTASNRIVKNEVNRIATWNVRSLGVRGKLGNIKLEMKRLNIDILGMSEIKRKEGDFWSDDYRITYSGDKKQQYRSWNNIIQGMGEKGKKITCFTIIELYLLNFKQTEMT
jgi:hypothetical protein